MSTAKYQCYQFCEWLFLVFTSRTWSQWFNYKLTKKFASMQLIGTKKVSDCSISILSFSTCRMGFPSNCFVNWCAVNYNSALPLLPLAVLHFAFWSSSDKFCSITFLTILCFQICEGTSCTRWLWVCTVLKALIQPRDYTMWPYILPPMPCPISGSQ